jgi:hypothetical protein
MEILKQTIIDFKSAEDAQEIRCFNGTAFIVCYRLYKSCQGKKQTSYRFTTWIKIILKLGKFK